MIPVDVSAAEVLALDFIRAHGAVQTRDLFENGPIATLAAARRIVRSLKRKGLIERTETDRGGFAGWCEGMGPR